MKSAKCVYALPFYIDFYVLYAINIVMFQSMFDYIFKKILSVLKDFLFVVNLNKMRFFSVFSVFLFSSYSFFYVIDFLPETPSESGFSEYRTSEGFLLDVDVQERDKEQKKEMYTNTNFLASGVGVPDISLKNKDGGLVQENPEDKKGLILPVRMKIDALGREIDIVNPKSSDISYLEDTLRHGAVRHPDTADLGINGNMIVLGHSSHLPNIVNRNYQIFNDIENLNWGDIIRVYSEEKEYIYRVDKVYEVKASEAVVPVAVDGHRITLITCDSFGTLDDRFVVEAERISVRIASSG